MKCSSVYDSNLRGGFTLIEMAVVLVVISLVAGAIIAGREMYHQAKLRAVISDVHAIQTAVRQYQFQFDALPGDHERATSYFPGQINGNGDGRISETLTSEYRNVFDHLAAAQILDAPRHPMFSKFMQSSAYDDGGIWGVYHETSWENKLVVRFARMQPDEPIQQTTGGFLTPVDGRSIDVKVDDGNGSSGRFVGARGFGGGVHWSDCSTGHTAFVIVGNWNLSQDAIRACQILYAF